MKKLSILTDEDLASDAKTKDHSRKQSILDSLTWVAKVAIYIVPFFLAIFYLIVLAHKIVINDWDGLEQAIHKLLIPVITYLVGMMSNSGILPKNGNQ